MPKPGIHIHTYVMDVTNEEEVDQIIPQMEKEVGPIDILVNNAGIIKRIPILEMKADRIQAGTGCGSDRSLYHVKSCGQGNGGTRGRKDHQHVLHDE